MILIAIIFWVIIILATIGGVITFVRIIKDWWNGKSNSGGDCSINGIHRMIRR